MSRLSSLPEPSEDAVENALCDVCELYSRESDFNLHHLTRSYRKASVFPGLCVKNIGSNRTTELVLHQEPAINEAVGVTGALVWDAALLLAKWLQETDFSGNPQDALPAAGLRVLELGCGTGAAGLAGACVLPRGSLVVLSDLKLHIPLLEKNIRANAVAISKAGNQCWAAELSWGKEETSSSQTSKPKLFVSPSEKMTKKKVLEKSNVAPSGAPSETEKIDLVIGSDLVYNQGDCTLLLETLESLLVKKKGARYFAREAVMAFELRSAEVTEFFLTACYTLFKKVEILERPEGFENDWNLCLLRLSDCADE